MPDYALEGPTWPTNSLTWSFADPANPANTAAFTGAIDAIYQQTVADAFTRWTSVSGLRFTQVADSASADIRVGWGDFSGTSVLGLTDYRVFSGTFIPNVQITLQDPQELALTQDPALGWVYAGNNATLQQVVTHEIGHALGLDHDGDTQSIMYPVALATNRDLDDTDIAGIDALYGSGTANPGQFSISGVTKAEGNGGKTDFVFTVTRSGGTAPTSVRFTTVDGTAIAARDYVANAGALVFADGVTSRTITVAVNGDTNFEPDESFAVQLSGPTNGASIATATATGTILNDDTPPGSVAIDNVTLAEGAGGITKFIFNVTRSGGTGPFAVDYRTADGTADSGDYIATSGTLNFAADVTSQTITVPVFGDYVSEPDETFSVLLSNPTNSATITAATGIGTILDDDTNPGSIAIDSVTMAEGTGRSTAFVFTVTRSGGTAPFTVDYRTQDGSAKFLSGDYSSVYGNLGFGYGQTTKTITVNVTADTLAEPDETFSVLLSNASGGGTITAATGIGTITNDDPSSPSGATNTATNTATTATGDPGITSPTVTASGTGNLGTQGVYRFFDRVFGTHFFTASAAERDTLIATRADLAFEGVGLQSRDPAAADPLIVPVFRFFDTAHGTHFFTASVAERSTILATRADLKDEGIGFYEHIAPAAGDQPVYRFFDTAFGTHFYTADASERATVLATRTDLKDEGIGFYAPTGP